MTGTSCWTPNLFELVLSGEVASPVVTHAYRCVATPKGLQPPTITGERVGLQQGHTNTDAPSWNEPSHPGEPWRACGLKIPVKGKAQHVLFCCYYPDGSYVPSPVYPLCASSTRSERGYPVQVSSSFHGSNGAGGSGGGSGGGSRGDSGGPGSDNNNKGSSGSTGGQPGAKRHRAAAAEDGGASNARTSGFSLLLEVKGKEHVIRLALLLLIVSCAAQFFSSWPSSTPGASWSSSPNDSDTSQEDGRRASSKPEEPRLSGKPDSSTFQPNAPREPPQDVQSLRQEDLHSKCSQGFNYNSRMEEYACKIYRRRVV